MCLSGFVGCSKILIVILLNLAFSFDALTTAGFKSNHNELSPEYSGILFGITNTIGNVPGFIGPAVAGYILQVMDGLSGWRMIFILGACVYIVGNVAFLLGSKFTIQKWNKY